MKIQIASDLHTEFHEDGGHSLLDKLASGQEADVLVIAGDLDMEVGLEETLQAVCGRWPQVVYVTGNHEYYRSNHQKVHDTVERASARLSNLHWLNDSHVDIDGQRFIGGTLWFKDRPDNEHWTYAMNDFKVITDLRGWVYEANERTTSFLRKEALPDDIVVTHHLPHPLSVAPRFKGSPLNRFFLCDCRRIIQACLPSFWIHGHTHCCFDYTVGDTRIVANPFGYPHERNRFNPHLYIEVP